MSTARDPLDLEIVIDREFYRRCCARLRSWTSLIWPVSCVLRSDAVNLSTGLKLSVMGITEELERFFLPGGRDR